MQTDKLFFVTLTILNEQGLTDQTFGIVKAENMPEALQYVGREYPHHSIASIEETHRIML